jgi:Zn-finger in ubiquitin-hydrolases and other protein
MSDNGCSHLDQAQDVTPNSEGCEDCLAIVDTWVHLRLCMSCGHVGCCDQSRNKHASRHAAAADHPLVQTFEPGEEWWWCYVDEVAFVVDGAPSFSHP